MPTQWVARNSVCDVLRYLKLEAERPYRMLYDLTAIDDDQGAVAVMLDLLNPAISRRKFRGQCRDSQETEGVFTGGGHFAPIWLAQS